MKGISAKIVTDEETVQMHTNFAEVKDMKVAMANPDIATYSIEGGVAKVHTNTIHSWGIQVYCVIPYGLLKAGQKYGISVRANRNVNGFRIQTPNSSHVSTVIVAPHREGDKVSAVCTLKKEDITGGLTILAFLTDNNTDYELRDFRIWEIDNLGGGNS